MNEMILKGTKNVLITLYIIHNIIWKIGALFYQIVYKN